MVFVESTDSEHVEKGSLPYKLELWRVTSIARDVHESVKRGKNYLSFSLVPPSDLLSTWKPKGVEQR